MNRKNTIYFHLCNSMLQRKKQALKIIKILLVFRLKACIRHTPDLTFSRYAPHQEKN